MTYVGKTLVFVILVMALAQAGLQIMFHVAQANWVDGYTKLNDRYRAVQADNDAYQADAKAARDQRDADVAAVKAEMDKVVKQLQDKEAELQARNKELQQTKGQSTQSDASLASSEIGNARRPDENKNLDVALKERETRINDLATTNNDLRDRAVRAEIESKSVNEKNQNLVTQIEELSKELVRAKNGGPASAGSAGSMTAKNPPPENVEGVVKTTDPSSGLLTLSVGSDSGVLKGHTLEVFRMNPPKYLGTVKIMDSRPNEAVGKPISKPSGTIQPGDRVASKILGS